MKKLNIELIKILIQNLLISLSIIAGVFWLNNINEFKISEDNFLKQTKYPFLFILNSKYIKNTQEQINQEKIQKSLTTEQKEYYLSKYFYKQEQTLSSFEALLWFEKKNNQYIRDWQNLMILSSNAQEANEIEIIEENLLKVFYDYQQLHKMWGNQFLAKKMSFYSKLLLCKKIDRDANEKNVILSSLNFDNLKNKKIDKLNKNTVFYLNELSWGDCYYFSLLKNQYIEKNNFDYSNDYPDFSKFNWSVHYAKLLLYIFITLTVIRYVIKKPQK